MNTTQDGIIMWVRWALWQKNLIQINRLTVLEREAARSTSQR